MSQKVNPTTKTGWLDSNWQLHFNLQVPFGHFHNKVKNCKSLLGVGKQELRIICRYLVLSVYSR